MQECIERAPLLDKLDRVKNRFTERTGEADMIAVFADGARVGIELALMEIERAPAVQSQQKEAGP